MSTELAEKVVMDSKASKPEASKPEKKQAEQTERLRAIDLAVAQIEK